MINATGVLLHTNLGRAPMSEAAVSAAAELASGYGNVELDVTTGDRGRRNQAVEEYLRLTTGAEAALVVNNNAAALFLILFVLAQGRSVPVSRGELIEIGGSYRLPELMAATGTRLVEVGTTNRTRVADYATVDEPALLLKVHPSNYRIVGFSEDATVADLASLAGEREIPLAFDIGSGLLDARVPWLDSPPAWLRGEPGVKQALAEGADLVSFSGDKLLGGPQAGIIVGRSDLVSTLRRHPVMRALRVDGSTDAALQATLEAYLTGRALDLPIWHMATLDSEAIGKRAVHVASVVTGTEVVDGASTLGAGSAPGAEIPTRLIKVGGGDRTFDRLLAGDPTILARRVAGDVLIDLRTVDPADDAVVISALSRA